MMRIEGSAGETFGTLLRTRAAGGFVLRESHYGAGLRTPAHHHPIPYLCLVVRGGMFERDGVEDRTYDPGSVHYHPTGDPHSGRIGPGGMVTLSVVPPRRVSARLETAARRLAPGPAGPATTLLGSRCYREFREADSASDLALEALALEMVASLLRQHGARRAPGGSRWLEDVRDYLHAHVASRIPLAELAGVAGVHEVHLVRAFRHRYGCTPGAYARRLRVEAARRALVATECPVAEIALDAGFANQAHFTRVFRQLVGIPPAAYRRLHRDRTP